MTRSWSHRGTVVDDEAHRLVSLAEGGPEMAVDGGWLVEEEAVEEGALPSIVVGGSGSMSTARVEDVDMEVLAGLDGDGTFRWWLVGAGAKRGDGVGEEGK
jgi:hypothetical protein